MDSQKYDTIIGMEVFTTKSPGIGGWLKRSPEDFLVQEISLDKTVAPLDPVEKEFPDQPGKFTAFYLVKRNIDTIHAIRQLSRALGVSYKRFSYAGIKDRRAVTSQLVSLYNASPHDLIGRDMRNIRILHPHRVAKSILPGALWGNRFNIIVRQMDVPLGSIHTRVEQIKHEYEVTGGILNFFGPQRFGVIYPTTHQIGKQILLGNLNKAIDILLHESEENKLGPESGNGKEPTNDRHPKQSPAYQTYERAIKQYLQQHPEDYQGSFRVLPKDLARLYLHAYQSYLFNRMISERVKRNISLCEPTNGDFTMPVNGEIHQVRMVSKSSLSSMRKEVSEGKRVIVIPLIGYDFEHITFTGPMGEIITSILTEEELAPEMFRLKHLPWLSSRGSFRSLLVHPEEFSTSVKEKEDPFVKIQFNLRKGSYASVILREFIKPKLATQL